MNLELRYRLPGQVAQTVPLSESRVIIGTLMSNQVVIKADDIEPIHAMLEDNGKGQWMLTDLGSDAGVRLNGKPVQVESAVKPGDKIEIGSVVIEVAAFTPPPPPPMSSDDDVDAEGRTVPPPPPGRTPTVKTDPAGRPGAVIKAAADSQPVSGEERRVEKGDILFSPRKARPSGDVLECVAYWGDTILDVELFHPAIKGYEKVYIGEPDKAQFIAGGEEDIVRHQFASMSDGGFKVNLLKGMTARFRKNGAVEKQDQPGSYSLGRRDLAHITYGSVRYFLLYVNPPALDLPRSGPKDPFFAGLMTIAGLLYVALMPVLFFTTPSKPDEEKDDTISVIYTPEKEEPPKPEEKPKPKVEIAEVKTPPPEKTPPPPKPKPVAPAKPVEKEKPQQTKPVEKPIVKPEQKATANLTEAKEQPKEPSKKAGDLSKLTKATEGMASTGAKSPDFKLAGAKTDKPKGPSGGEKGGGMNQTGGAIKGNEKSSVKGVEGPKNKLASGVNLSKLGIGVGKILSETGPGAVHTKFESSAGGAGGGMGSGSKTYGLGGVGNSQSLGIAGAAGQTNNFGGGGGGGYLSGEGGSGGRGGAGLGKGFGGGDRGRANVSVPPGDPVATAGLTPQEILAVIRAHLNEIRHCYEQLLQRSPNAAGKIATRFVVGLSGRVDSAVVESSTISDSIMQGCVTGKIQRWKFPEPRGGQPVTVNYPFVFNPL